MCAQALPLTLYRRIAVVFTRGFLRIPQSVKVRPILESWSVGHKENSSRLEMGSRIFRANTLSLGPLETTHVETNGRNMR